MLDDGLERKCATMLDRVQIKFSDMIFLAFRLFELMI